MMFTHAALWPSFSRLLHYPKCRLRGAFSTKPPNLRKSSDSGPWGCTLRRAGDGADSGRAAGSSHHDDGEGMFVCVSPIHLDEYNLFWTAAARDQEDCGASAMVGTQSPKISALLAATILLFAHCSAAGLGAQANLQPQVERQSSSLVIQGRITKIQGDLVTV